MQSNPATVTSGKHMIRELVALAALTDTSNLPPVPDQTEDGNSALVAELEFRLQRANAQVHRLMRDFADSSKPDPEEIDTVVNGLNSSLRGLTGRPLDAFLLSFSPDFFHDTGLHPLMAQAIKTALLQFCTANKIAPSYAIWSTQ